MQYVTATEFLQSGYGLDFDPVTGAIFETEEEIDTFLATISSLIDLYAGRTFGPERYVDMFHGYDGSTLFLENIPVTGIVSVEYEPVGGSKTTLSASTYTLFQKTGKLKFSGNLDSSYIYTITYDAGYSEVPEPIKLATMMLANTYANAIENNSVGIADGGSTVRFRFAKFQEDFANPQNRLPHYAQGIPITVEAILRRYRYQR